ncbi:MFS transporter [Pseudaestuariivita sp.]|uniref:MFS transporter n=1 Tax=Pseudaestuariivita sp. TaxID=2211669 RepID=UPI004059D3B4
MLLARNANYRRLFSASAISNLGDGVSALAFPWLASLITRDPALIALVAFATRLPWLLLSIPAGVIVDRQDRRVLMVQADVLRMLLTCGVIGLILSLPALPPPGEAMPYILALSALAFLLGTAEVVRDNAAQTMLPSIVARADLESANGQMWSIEQVMGAFVGPPLAGVLIALAVPAPFLVEAVSFALAAWLVWCIRLPRRTSTLGGRVWQQALEGWRWMRAHPVILRLAIMLGLINALNVMGMTVLILVSQETLGLSAVGHGVLLTAGAAGGVVGGLLGPHVVKRLGGQRSLMLALLLMPLPYVVIAVADSAALVAVALFIEMCVALLWNIVTVSYRQRLIPDVLLGRVNSLYRFFGWGMMPAGALVGGWLVALAEPELGRAVALTLPYWLGALGFVLIGMYGAARLRL